MITDKLRHELNDLVSLKRRPIIEGWTELPKAELLAGLVIDHKPQLLVEVGVFGGRSLFAQAMALRENGMGVIWGIDPWTLDAALEGDIGEENKKWWTENLSLEEIYLGFLRAVLEFQLTKQVRWIRERGERAVRLFDNASIDMLHIDGNHSELASTRDVNLWHPKIKPGGFLIMDDVSWGTVAKALKQIANFGYKTIAKTGEYAVYQKGK